MNGGIPVKRFIAVLLVFAALTAFSACGRISPVDRHPNSLKAMTYENIIPRRGSTLRTWETAFRLSYPAMTICASFQSIPPIPPV